MLDPLPAAEDLRAEMGPAVDLEDAVVEVLDAERKPRHPQLTEGFDLRLRQCPRLAFKRHFLGIIPTEAPVEAVDEPLELLHREERRRATAEVDVAELAPGDGGLRGDEFRLARQPLRIALDVAGRGVGVDAEIAELAPFPAERHMEIEAQCRAGGGGGESLEDRRDRGGRPGGEGGVVGDEVTARFGRFAHRWMAPSRR